MDEDEEINYKTLRKIQQNEKKTPFLTKLFPGFYQELNEYIESMKKRLNEEKDNTKKTLLKEEIENNKKIIYNIYEHREKKIVLAAVTKARGGEPDLRNMLSSEIELYNLILECLKDKRNVFFGKKPEIVYEENKFLDENEENDAELKNKIISEEENIIDEPKIRKNNENPVIRVFKDMPEFMGTDKRKYFLKKDDVLSIPKDMADMLEKRKAAEIVDYKD